MLEGRFVIIDLMGFTYKNSFIEGPYSLGDKWFCKITCGHDSFPAPLAVNDTFALTKAREMVDEISDSIQYTPNPTYSGSKPYNPFNVCPSCGKGNKNDRLRCWSCNWELISLEKPYFGPPSGSFKRPKITKY